MKNSQKSGHLSKGTFWMVSNTAYKFWMHTEVSLMLVERFSKWANNIMCLGVKKGFPQRCSNFFYHSVFLCLPTT